MATKLKKKSKSTSVSDEAKSPAAPVAVSADPDTILDEATASVATAPEAAPVAEPTPEAAPATVSVAPTKKGDYVRVMVLRDIAPPPVIGNTDLGALLGVRALKATTEYSIPLECALLMKDAKAAALIGG